ncbi:MAG: hypothetical protein ACRD2B_02505 [Terriglobia bacterium]
MARVSYVEPEGAPTEVKEIYEQKLKGKPANVHKALAHLPQVLNAFLTFYPAIGRSLNRRLYELLYIRVTILNQCDY